MWASETSLRRLENELARLISASGVSLTRVINKPMRLVSHVPLINPQKPSETQSFNVFFRRRGSEADTGRCGVPKLGQNVYVILELSPNKEIFPAI